MADLTSGASAKIQLDPGQSLRVEAEGGATNVTSLYGAPAGTTAVTGSTTFGPYSVPAMLRVVCASGACSYATVRDEPAANALTAPQVTALQSVVSGDGTDFSTTIPLDAINKWMPQTQVTGALSFTPGATLMPGGQCTLTLVSNGVNTPTFAGFSKWGGSSAWDNTNGAVNELTFFVLGSRAYYSIAQAVPLELYFDTQFVRFSSLTNMSESGDLSAGYSYTTTSTAGQIAKTPSLTMEADGYVEATVQTAGASAAWVIGLDTNAAGVTLFTGVDYGIYPRNTGYYQALVAGANATHSGSATVTVTAGDKMRLTRTGTTISFDIIRAGAPINIHTVTGVSAVNLQPVVTGVNLSGIVQGPISIRGGA